MRYRALVVLLLAAGLYAPPSYAQTQDEKALALLRASSAQSAIITFCGKHFAIDGTTALRDLTDRARCGHQGARSRAS